MEVPFVPAAARRPRLLDSRTEDTIVVVGQTRAKKRKRNSKKIVEQGESESATAAGAEHRMADMSKAQGGEEEPGAEMETASDEQDDFDFSAVPNILDDDPDSQERRTKQKRPKKQDRANRAKGLSFDLVHTHSNC